jgi:hypothetical protein
MKDTVAVTAKAIEERQAVPCGCHCAGGDRGVDLRMHYPSTVAFFLKRRTFPTDDKKIQQELVGAAGLRSVRRQGSKFSDLEPFLRSDVPCCLEAH